MGGQHFPKEHIPHPITETLIDPNRRSRLPDRVALIGSAGARSRKEDLLWSEIHSCY